MSYKREVIDIRVSQRILWVGAEAYPLHNIARAQTIKLVPKRGQAFKALALWVFLGVAAVGVGELLGLASLAVAVVVVLVFIVVSTIRLVVALSTPTFYVLIIETAGTPL